MNRGVDRPLYYVRQNSWGRKCKAQLHWQYLYKAKKGAMFSRDNTWTNAAKMGQEEWCEMYVRPFHRELSLVGMRQFCAGNFCLLL